MFSHKIDRQIELRLMERHHATEFFQLVDANREHWRKWHPWLPDTLRSAADAEKFIAAWLLNFAGNKGFCAGVWSRERLCGMIHHVNPDWANRSVFLSYWLDEAHQGMGIMTVSCSAVVSHAFDIWKMNRVAIQCAVENARSRAIPGRLGFKLEGIVREAEWLYDRFVDHALYSLLKSDYENGKSNNAAAVAPDPEA
jgi:ribosomal-protein-serine acetyltransferase